MIALRSMEIVLVPIAWAITVYGSLQVQHVSALDSHGICGPWGCGPASGSLIALHLCWLAILAPVLVYLPLRSQFSRRNIRRIAVASVSLGLVGIAAITLWQWMVWLPQASQWSRDYIWHRCGFAIATAVDLPVLQLLFIGLTLWIFNARRCKVTYSGGHSQAQSDPQSTNC